MAVTTYLLGAGASVNAIPVVDDLAKGFEKFRENINMFKTGLQPENANDDRPKILKRLVTDIDWLLPNIKNHTSIDTFAKKLYLKDDFNNLTILKNVLNFFFSYIQHPQNVDIRYDNFLASILLKNVNEFPRKVRVLSWNYDSQLEIAYSNLTDNRELERCRIALNILFDRDIYLRDTHINAFTVFKLNGTAGLYNERNEFQYYGFLPFLTRSTQTSPFFDKLLRTYGDSFNLEKYKHSLTFAWENFEAKKAYFQKIKDSIKETEALVIIGYSFPFFNREIDKFLINDCMPGLKYIYIQDPQADVVKQRLKGITNLEYKNVELLSSVDSKQFAFANELEL